MNFEHTEDRRMLADTLNRFISKEYNFKTRDSISTSAQGFSPAHWQQFAELGVIGALFEEGEGGFGGSGFDLAVVFEELGRGLVVEPFLGAVLAGGALAHAGNDGHKALLDDLIAGVVVPAFAHAEKEGHYGLSYVRTTARANNGGWVLDGAKCVVQQGAAADIIVVSARTAGAHDDSEGISLFLLPRDTPGLSLRPYPNIDGGCAAELTLSSVSLPAGALLGAKGKAYATLEHCIGRGILALCAEALGAMNAAKQATLEYLKTRKQFGVPIGSFQALQHRMADMLLEIEQSRSAVINAALALEMPGIAREKALSAAKFTIGRVGALVAEECIQMHGAIGMTWELPLTHYAKRLVMIDHQLGDEDYHLERYIALNRA